MAWALYRAGARLGAPGARLAACRSGLAAVEFAMILPLLLILYIGGAEFSRAQMNYRRVVTLARTLADLTSLGDVSNPMAQATMNDIFAAAQLVLQPFDPLEANLRVSAIGITMNGTNRTVRVCSSQGLRRAAHPVGVAPADLVIPASYNTNGMHLVVAEVAMTYKPMTGTAFARLIGTADGEYPLAATLIWPTRGGTSTAAGRTNEVILPGGAACP